MAQLNDLLFALGWDDHDSVIGSYIEHVANGGLTAYKTIFQTGKKHGEPVYMHFLNGVFTGERLRPLLDITDNEARVLYSAYSIHDINKLIDHGEKSFNAIAVKETLSIEMERIGVPAFFPAYLDYLADITTLVRCHSGHYHTAGELLVRTHNPYRLDRDRLERVLCPLMKALDTLELSASLTERDSKDAFLAFLNSVTEQQYTFVYHQVSEQRGLLTNIIHNEVSRYLEGHFGLTPLLFYPDGVAYLMDQAQPMKLDASHLAAVGQAVASKTAGMSRGNFAKFIKSGNQGIKVDKQCLELGIPFSDIFDIVHNLVMVKVSGKRFKIEENEAKCRSEIQATLGNLRDEQLTESVRTKLTGSLYPSTQVAMGAAELLRSYYILLTDHFAKQIGDSWQYLYRLLGITPEAAAVYNLCDPRYQRAYVLAHDLDLTIEPLHERILADGRSLMSSDAADDTTSLGDCAVLADYVARNVTFSFEIERQLDFAAALHKYVETNHRQCCYCGSEFATDELMAQRVPLNLGVQSFSNRLPGGSSREPKRNACEICRVQFTLEKLTHQSLKGTKTIFLHLYPYSFYTDVFLVALRAEVQDILAQDTAVIFTKTDDAFQGWLQSGQVRLTFATRNKQGNPFQNGLALPQFAEAIGNVLTFPLNCPGDNDSEQFLFALQNALLLQRFFGCKVLMTDSAVPVLSSADFGDLYVDNAPLSFLGLLPGNDLDTRALAALWDDFLALHSLALELWVPRGKESREGVVAALARSLIDNRLSLFYAADMALERRLRDQSPSAKQQNVLGSAIRKMMPHINQLVRGGTTVEQLRYLARLARDGKIKGSTSWRRNSVLDPLESILDALENKSPHVEVSTVQAALVEDIFRHIESTAEEGFKPGRPKYEKVQHYVAYFFEHILMEVYHGNTQKLLADRKTLRSAYLFYFNEQPEL
ncbi:MAG: type I-D CRISPR-associated protein Cas10d/Csc3 [Chloroflexi bacterium]|nr:type I-D CRISPR-associated protein Cas10d/Csc3 [Chloroflexota bacterium]